MIRRVVALLLFAGLAVGAARAQSGVGFINVSRTEGPSGSPSIVVDGSGTIHVAWTDRPDGIDFEEQFVFYARSVDGADFEPPRRISIGVDTGARAREVRLVATADGSVAVAWWATVVGEDDRRHLTAFVARSVDAGQTFASPLASSLRFREDQLGDRPLSVTTTLSLAASPDGGIGLLASVPDYDRGYNLYFASSTDGASFAEPVKVTRYTQVIPRASTNALTYVGARSVVAYWTESNGDFLDETKDVYSAASDDGGRTFSSSRRVAHVRGLVGGAVTSDDTTILITHLKRSPSSRVTVKAFRSTDGGATFDKRSKLAKTSITSRLHQASVAANAAGIVAVTWVENGSSPPSPHGIYLAVSRDGGRTFETPALVVDGYFPDPPAVAIEPSGGLVVAFTSRHQSPEDREVLVVRMAP